MHSHGYDLRCCNVVDIMINMQITNPVVCDTSKGSLYIQIKPTLAVEHAFPLTGFAIRRTLQMVAAVGKSQLADRSCLTH